MYRSHFADTKKMVILRCARPIHKPIDLVQCSIKYVCIHIRCILQAIKNNSNNKINKKVEAAKKKATCMPQCMYFVYKAVEVKL